MLRKLHEYIFWMLNYIIVKHVLYNIETAQYSSVIRAPLMIPPKSVSHKNWGHTKISTHTALQMLVLLCKVF